MTPAWRYLEVMVTLPATDNNGTQKNTTLSLTIDNTPPQLDATLTPELVRTGNIITITATTSSDAEKVTAVMFGETLKLKKQSPNTWMLRYAVPTANDGLHNILITATDKAGNQAQTTLNFTVDNTPPTLNPTLNQTLVRSGDKITITTTSDPDTQSVKAYIQDNTYQLTKNQDNTWSREYTTPQIGDGVYSILLMAQDLVGNTNHTPLTFTVDNTPPVINPEISPEAGKPGENITITVTTSPDTQNVVAIIGTQRINLTPTNGTWTTNYTIPPDSTLNIHTIRIEGTDTVGNIGKNTASYEVLNPNPIPSWLEDLINPDTPNPGNTPTITTNTGSGNNGGSGNGGSSSGSDNDDSDSDSRTGSNYNHNTTTQLENDIDYIRKRFRDITGITKAQDTIEDIKLPDWKLTIDPPDIDQWDILDMAISAAGELLFLGTIANTPGAGEYLQQVQTGMSTAMKSIRTGLRYFTKNPRRAFDYLKRGFQQAGNAFKNEKFMKDVSDRTFKIDPNIGQEVLVQGLCKFFPKQAAEIRTFFTILSSIKFITDPLDIVKALKDVVYSL